MKVFRKHSQWNKAANYLWKIAPPKVFDWAPNQPLEREIVQKLKQKIKISQNLKNKILKVKDVKSVK